jgi:hypothetical protein
LIGRLLDDVGIIVPIVIVGGGVATILGIGFRLYRRTIGSRRDLARRLNQLACGVTLDYVKERLGIPAFVRPFGQVQRREAATPPRPPARNLLRVLAGAHGDAVRVSGIPRQEGLADCGGAGTKPLRELIFREKHAWVQVLADESDAVTRFSITVTDPRFQFSTRLLTWGHLSVRLGRTPFSDVPEEGFTLRGQSLRIGAHNHEYAEAYYFGNPGQYQHFVLSSNEMGTGDFGYAIQGNGPSFTRSGLLAEDSPLPEARRQEFDPRAEYAQIFRRTTTINTLTVLGPTGNQAPGMLAEPRGPDSLHVRVLVPGRRERREIQRRIQRINKQLARSRKILSGGSD